MSILEKAKSHLFEKIIALIGNDSLVNDIMIDYPPQSEWGDLSVACFILGKINKRPPADLARDLAAKITPDEVLAKAEAVGPYVNFSLRQDYLARVIKEAEQESYGRAAGSGQRVMIEYSNPNTHKEYHIGHLRNICYGDAVARLLAAGGAQVDKVSYINDCGINTAKTVWQFKRSQHQVGGDYILGQLYTQAVNDLKNNAAGQEEVAVIMRDIENRHGNNYHLWQQTRQWSLDYFATVYDRLGVNFDHTYYESEVMDEGRELVFKLLKQGILKESQGAVIADFSEDGLGVLVLLRSDGTALYPVGDLALAWKKMSKVGLNESLYVVDKRQDLYFEQLFKLLRLLHCPVVLKHLPYDIVRLPSGLMSSRLGNVITFEEIYAVALKRLLTEVIARHGDWSEHRQTACAKMLTIGVLKFEMLKVGADKPITFDMDEALRFDGFTSVYVQYTTARLASLLRKGKAKINDQPVLDCLTDSKEKQLIMSLAKFPHLVQQAGQQREPSLVAKYSFDLTRLFNDYYHSVSVIQSDKKLQAARLALCAAVRQNLVNGLALLGIAAPEEM